MASTPKRIATTPRSTTQPHREAKPSSALSVNMVLPPAYLEARDGESPMTEGGSGRSSWFAAQTRRLPADRLLPGDDLAVAVGDERDAAVVGDDDGQTARVLADEAVGGAVAGADV